jgi:hypothetical protein
MQVISRAQASKEKLSHYFTSKPCKHGHIDARRVNDRVCMGCDRQKKTALRKEKPEEVKSSKRASYAKHQDNALKVKKAYRQANKGKINALVAARKIVIKQRTPKWLDEIAFDRIKNEYQLAALLSKLTGSSWHVDHIIPLQGKLVSGLHVPSNLRVLPALENISKKNKFEVIHA